MSDMKCPFCNGELVGTIGHPICRNQDCVMCDDPIPQELLDLLSDTKKKLDIAVDTLKIMNDGLPNGNRWKWEIDKALEQITTPKQKDVK